MPRIGAHMSVAGGVSKAVDRAEAHHCEALQIFTKNANQWRNKPPAADEITRFRRRLDESGIAPVVSHASYLINLATTVPALRALSVEALVDELDRAHALGLLGVVIHPGTCTAGTEANASSASTGCASSMRTIRSGRVGAGSIATSTSARVVWGSNRSGVSSTILASAGCHC